MRSLTLFTLLLSATVVAQEPDSSSAIFKMREAERSFAKSSVMFGRNAAFVENLAENSIVFTGTWISNGRQFSKERTPAPIVLKWEPEYMDISDSRDFGISTGPWEVQEYRPNTAPISRGYFLTVWKKQSDGLWKAILDDGISTPPPSGDPHSFSFRAGADKVISNPLKINTDSSSKELFERDKEISDAWSKSQTSLIYFTFLDKDARIQRNGHLPTTNRDSINHWILGLDRKLAWKISGSGAASSGDLGFTYGILEIPGRPEAVKGHYVRIWRKPADGKWRIIIDMFNMN